MADISKIKLPDGIVYNIKDTVAREMLAHSLELVICQDGFPGPAGPTYQGKIYLLPHEHGTQDIYDEYVVVQDVNDLQVWTWEKIGNTDIDMSNYSLKTHKHTVTTNIQVAPHTYTPAGTVGPAVFVGQAATINLTGDITGDVSIVVRESATGNYTPTGRVDLTLGNSPNHTHTLGGTTKYLHKVSVPKTFATETAVTAITTSKLVKTQIKAVTGTATVSRLTGSTTKNVATVGTSVNIPKYTLDSQNTTVHNIGGTGAVETGQRATGSLGSSPVSQGTNTPMWNAKIDPIDSETLMFEFKDMTTAQTVTGVTPTAVNFKNLTADGVETLTPAVANGSVHEYTKTDVTVATTNNTNIDVATGAVASNGGGADIATGATTQSVLKSVSASEDVYNNINTTSSGGEAVITGVDASTGSAGAHTHQISGEFTGDPVEISGDVSTDNIIAQTTYTPAGTVNAPVFTGEQATLEHTVTGNGPYTTSQANS